jgi:SAM-dependent methyltransferase
MACKQHRDFDHQASSFDRRAGLPPTACNAVALELLRIASLGPADMLLEIGAGTGQIGRALCAMPIRYLGIDLSPRMLSEFAQRCRGDGRVAPIAVADADRTWPVRDGSATAIFGSRSLHLLPVPHLVEETIRVAAPGRSYVILGRIERDPGGLRTRLRREMHAYLIRRGYAPREGLRHGRELLDAFIRLGALAIQPHVAAAWPVRRSAREVIDAWRAKAGLAGIDVSPAEKEALFSELAAWAERMIGSLDIVETNEEKYMLAGVQLPARSLAYAAP